MPGWSAQRLSGIRVPVLIPAALASPVHGTANVPPKQKAPDCVRGFRGNRHPRLEISQTIGAYDAGGARQPHPTGLLAPARPGGSRTAPMIFTMSLAIVWGTQPQHRAPEEP